MKIIILTITFILGVALKQISGPVAGTVTNIEYKMAGDTSRYIFTGAEACATKCHNNNDMGFQYDIWRRSSHAGAFYVLNSDHGKKYASEAGIKSDPDKAPECLKCHVTAFGADSSSLGASYSKADGITCEACHKGEFRPKTFLPGKEDCLKCHNCSIHPVPEFDFVEKCRAIEHHRPVHKS